MFNFRRKRDEENVRRKRSGKLMHNMDTFSGELLKYCKATGKLDCAKYAHEAWECFGGCRGDAGDVAAPFCAKDLQKALRALKKES